MTGTKVSSAAIAAVVAAGALATAGPALAETVCEAGQCVDATYSGPYTGVTVDGHSVVSYVVYGPGKQTTHTASVADGTASATWIQDPYDQRFYATAGGQTSPIVYVPLP